MEKQELVNDAVFVFNLAMAEQLVSAFNGDRELLVDVAYSDDGTGHQGDGLYVMTEGVEGSVFLFPEGELGEIWDSVNDFICECVEEVEDFDAFNLDEVRALKVAVNEFLEEIANETLGDFTIAINREPLDQSYYLTIAIRDGLDSEPEVRHFGLVDDDN